MTSDPRLYSSILTLSAYTFHAYGRSEGIAGIIISDHEYPALVAHQLLSKVVDEFLTKHPRSAFANSNQELPFPALKDYIVKYQDPQQADSIMKIQKELDETKITLHKTIESMLERGEKIDNLVAKSDGLSAQSKMFYTQVSLSQHLKSRSVLNRRFYYRPRNRTLAVLSCRALHELKSSFTDVYNDFGVPGVLEGVQLIVFVNSPRFVQAFNEEAGRRCSDNQDDLSFQPPTPL